MTRFYEDYTGAEQDQAIAQRQAIRDLQTANPWTASDQRAIKVWLTNVGRMLLDLRSITAEEHVKRMGSPDIHPEYYHDWMMRHDPDYDVAFLYTFDPSFRARADSDAGVYTGVLAGYVRGLAFPYSRPDIITAALGEAHPTAPASPAPPTFEQRGFRGRNDDGTLTSQAGGATWKADENTGWSQLAGANFRIRFQSVNRSDNGWVGGMQIWCRKNAGDWQPVTGASSVARPADSPHLVDNNSFAGPLLTMEVGASYNSGSYDEIDGFSPFRICRAKYTIEHEFCLSLVPADVVVGDTVAFQLRRGTEPGASTPLDTYSQMPVVTVT